MDTNTEIDVDDPQFVEVLRTCLIKEIGVITDQIKESETNITCLKEIMRDAIEKRKEIKKKIKETEETLSKLNETSAELHKSVVDITDTLETMKLNADDQYKLMQVQFKEYENLVKEYREASETYHAMYQKFPLVKARNEARNRLEKLKIEYMVLSYKKDETTKIIKQRERIDWIRTRNKIVEFAAMMVENSKLEKRLVELRVDNNRRKQTLHSIQMELQELRKKEEDMRKQKQQKIIEVAPPRMNKPQRGMYAQNEPRRQYQWQQIQETFDDTASVNTLALEELCTNENDASALAEVIDVETGMTITEDVTSKPAACSTPTPLNSKTTAVREETDKRAASMPQPEVEKVVNVITATDSDEEIKEIRREESRESIKVQPGSRTKESPLKHGIVADSRDEIEAKRIRLQTENRSGKSGNKITSLQPLPAVVETVDVDMKSVSSLGPRIRKIEKVQYNMKMITPKPNQETNIPASSMFSPLHEYCESNASFDFASKAPSLYEDSLCNYKTSSIGEDISAEYVEDDMSMISNPRDFSPQQDDEKKDPPKERKSLSHFNNIVDLMKNKDRKTLF